jgi:hypothetical protein
MHRLPRYRFRYIERPIPVKNNKIAKLALIGAVLVSTLSAASAQGFSGAHDNGPIFQAPYSQQQQPEQNKSDVGENGGGA